MKHIQIIFKPSMLPKFKILSVKSAKTIKVNFINKTIINDQFKF
jgi:hypothetical protein